MEDFFDISKSFAKQDSTIGVVSANIPAGDRNIYYYPVRFLYGRV